MSETDDKYAKSKYVVRDGTLAFERDDQCCFCLPIGIGAKMLGLLYIVGAIWGVY